MMMIEKGNYITHVNKSEWGLGKVISVFNNNKFQTFFVNAGLKLLDYNLEFIQVESEINSHPVLDDIDMQKATKSSSYKCADTGEMVKIFLEIFPEGFNDQKYFEHERGYKLRASELLVSSLGQEKFKKFMKEKKYQEISKLALSVINKTNLIFPNEKMGLKDGLESEKNKEKFSTSLYQLLYGPHDLELRFMNFAHILGELKADKWTIQTYFLYLLYPEKHLFMKPEITQKAADICAFNLHYQSQLNWKTYSSLLQFGKHINNKLNEYGEKNLIPKDMIDVQSFLWSVANKDAYGDV
ncbi:MAG: DUF3553 domain-containing protein [Pseudomonadota bacterium]|nr:DUF3553 domain-containing protein [Pseudomonadota bacterium]